MSEQAGTLTTDKLRQIYIRSGGNVLDFEQWLEEHDATTEQRGAENALRDAATAIEKNQVIIDGDHFQPCNSCMSIHMQFLDYRADQIKERDNGRR